MKTKHYHCNIKGWDKTTQDGGISFGTDVFVTGKSVEECIKNAKEIYPKKHWWITYIQECLVDHTQDMEKVDEALALLKGSGDVQH